MHLRQREPSNQTMTDERETPMRTAPDVHNKTTHDGDVTDGDVTDDRDTVKDRTAGRPAGRSPGRTPVRTGGTRTPPSRRGGVAVVDRDTGSARRRREAPDPVGEADDTTGVDTAPTRTDDVGGTAAPAARPRHAGGRRWRRALPWALAVLGLVGTLVFGHAWASQNARTGQEAQVRTVSSDFLLALTNFDARNVDADFTRIQGYATGDFAKQSNQFFGSTIRTQLEAALASSRGQLRSQYVQSLSGNQASVYSVVDQTYVNNKMQSPAADELQIVTDLTEVGGTWKVGDVTVLNNGGGASASASNGSGGTTGGTSGASTSTTAAGG